MLTRDAYGGGRVGRRRDVILRVLARGRAPPPGPATAARGRRACVRGCGFYALCLERYMYALTTCDMSLRAPESNLYELAKTCLDDDVSRDPLVRGRSRQRIAVARVHTLTL